MKAEIEKAWQCAVCGYVHRGEAAPANCPVCGVDSDLFSEMPEVGAPRSAAREEERATATAFDGSILVVGGGVAGITAAEAAREAAPGARIVIAAKEEEPPYLRLNLTRYLAGEADAASLTMNPPGWFAEKRIDLVHGDVADLGVGKGKAALRDGRELPYDRLVLACGAHPFVPPIPGAERKGVRTLRTLRDADAIAAAVEPGTSVVCVGGGLLGLETAGALARRGARVSVVEGWPWLLPRQLPERAGRLLEGALSGAGIRAILGAKVAEISGGDGARAVVLANGDEHPASLVIITAGVRPNSYLARQAGIAVDAGVAVDDGMRTSREGVFAAGDVAEHHGVVYGIWPAAYATGRVAGANAAGGRAGMARMPPSNRLKVLGVDLFSVGVVNPTDGSAEIRDEEPAPGAFRRLVRRDGRLIGAALYGDTSAAKEVQEAIETGARWG